VRSRSATNLIAALPYDIGAARLAGRKVGVLTKDVTQAFPSVGHRRLLTAGAEVSFRVKTVLSIDPRGV